MEQFLTKQILFNNLLYEQNYIPNIFGIETDVGIMGGLISKRYFFQPSSTPEKKRLQTEINRGGREF